MSENPEQQRLNESEKRKADWKDWGPYVSDRAWGTVREDYSEDGEAWEYFPHSHAHKRAYRWNEDGIGGFCNRMQNLCMAPAFWNGKDEVLKERLFGLDNHQGNHGEDVKECYYYLDSTPTHSYVKMLYKYPHNAYPYQQLIAENGKRNRQDLELELTDLMKEDFKQGRYFDIFIEYAKADCDDILCRITAYNRSDEEAELYILPQLWYRNTWSWGYSKGRPGFHLEDDCIHGDHRHLKNITWHVRGECDESRTPEWLFTDNDSNVQQLYGSNDKGYFKDAFHRYIIKGEIAAVNSEKQGTKVAQSYFKNIAGHSSMKVEWRYSQKNLKNPFKDFEKIFDLRLKEADQFYEEIHGNTLNTEDKNIQRQAFAGLMWSKQFYHYGVDLWLKGDPASPPPAKQRGKIRNGNWKHLYNLDVISMPDKWEYPWFAAWDLAFHTIPIAMIDPEWAKRQLILMTREWYMHPGGQIPAYEWNFEDVNPPVHAWAAWRVYKISKKRTGVADTEFLEKIFHKLLLNFTWWVNQKDLEGNNIFQGGFLGLDNIGVFDRSKPLPTGGYIEQADGTAWMGMYCLNMLAISLELAKTKPAYEDVATKFFEHFIYIADAITHLTCDGKGLWDKNDGFFYDMLHLPDDGHVPLKIKSFVGLIPLFAVETLDEKLLQSLPRFRRRLEWFVKYRPELIKNIAPLTEPGCDNRRLLSIVNKDQLTRVLERMFDPNQFLSDYGLRALSKEHEANPYVFSMCGHENSVSYEPGESQSPLFGGNSNWRGPIWFPVNYLMIESLQKYHHYYDDKLSFTGLDGQSINTLDAANILSDRLVSIFQKDENGNRPVYAGDELYREDPNWSEYHQFYEYFHGDNGRGLGASHQTGWTALVAKLLARR